MKRWFIVRRNIKQWAVIALLLAAPAAVKAAQWPNVVATSLNLYTAVNNCSTVISSSMTISQTTATVVSASCFPSSGLMSMGGEVMTYTSKDSTHLYGLTRAYDGTTASAYYSGMTVRMNIVAKYHNALADELIAMSTFFFQGNTVRISTQSSGSTPTFKVGGIVAVEEIIGTSNTYNSSWGIQVWSPSRSSTGGNANINALSTNAQGINGGGTLGLGGRYIDSDNTPKLFGIIGGRKEDNTSAVINGYLQFITPSAGTYAEQARITSTGTLVMSGTGNATTYTARTSTPSFVSTQASIWSVNVGGSAEMKVIDGAGNITQISPHNADGDWVFDSYNAKTGKRTYINMTWTLHFLVIGVLASLAFNLGFIFVMIRRKRGE